MSGPDAPLVTLIVPTRERSETLRYTLRSALEQASSSYEVIASDNFSQDDTPAVLRSFSDPRLRTLRTDRRLSMCDHWEFALGHARGAYIVFIGDDDAVLPGGIDGLIDLIRRRPSQAYFWKPPVYAWPMEGRPAWIRFMPRPTREAEVPLRPKVRRVLRYGGWTYANLPCVYHASVSRHVLDAIRTRSGRVFHTTQPDVFTCMAVPVFASSFIRAGRPFTTHGISAKSNAGASVTRGGEAVVSRFIREYGDYPLHRSLYPGVRPAANLVVDAILVALDLFPEYYAGMRFNYDAMWAFLHRIDGPGSWEILRNRREIRRHHRFSVPRFLWYLALQEGVVRARRTVARLLSLSHEAPSDILEFARTYAKVRPK